MAYGQNASSCDPLTESQKVLQIIIWMCISQCLKAVTNGLVCALDQGIKKKKEGKKKKDMGSVKKPDWTIFPLMTTSF